MKLLLLVLMKLDNLKEISVHLKIISDYPQKFLNMLNSYLYCLIKEFQVTFFHYHTL